MNDQKVSTSPDVPPQIVMLQMITGFWAARAIYVAAKLGLADYVEGQPKTAAELAAATGTHAPSLYRVLRALASLGIFSEGPDQRFTMTPLAATLLTHAPGSLRALATVELGEEHYPAWGDVLHSVKTGEIAFNHTFGMPVWEYYAKHPENAQTFNEAMVNLTDAIHEAVMKSYDFSPFGRLVDMGGGHGGLITAILKVNPRMQGVLFDAPLVIETAKSRIEAEGLAARCELAAGDFFQSVPEGGDAYLLKWIIHDWDDERSVAILKNCHRAMGKNSKLLLVETVIPPGNEPVLGKFMDLNMLVMTGGRERTESEFRTLLAAAGFRLTRIVPTPSPMSVIEGVKA